MNVIELLFGLLFSLVDTPRSGFTLLIQLLNEFMKFLL